ncbi:hypothetical protein [Halopseudomonas bauzanensis]|uniref:hypothetical protein n=1 Tax=Halopseudomonas bauzanensis TaxID=653930 RepID=UPI0025565730|nr:hypothetical protein [Halopseudomonas bauzanensis]
MLKHVINDVTVVIFAIVLLAALSAAALHRTQQVQITEATIPLCHTAHCHAMNPGHWLTDR